MTELSRVVLVARLPAAFTVEATANECAALATRLMIPAVHALACRYALERRGDVVTARMDLHARVQQTCVVTLDPVDQDVVERATLRFVPAGRETASDDPDAPDELPYDGMKLDLGEAAAEQLALGLDPYPRSDAAGPGE